MATPELIQERVISGKGVLKIPADMKKYRALVLYADLVRAAKNRYGNVNYNPERSRFGTLTFLREGYVIADIAIEYDRQAFDGINDICGQTLLALKCALQATNQNFEFLAAGLGIDTTVSANLIADYENLRLSWDEARLVCYADTALQLRLYGTKYDVCNPDYDDDQPPPPPPPPRPRVPPGTPIDDLSPPYDEEDNDGGNTEPYEGDESPPPEPQLPDNSQLKWNLSTSRNPRDTYAQAVFNTFTPVSSYSVTGGNVDQGLNAKEWLATFVSGTSTVNGSAVGFNNPEDKPLLYLWDVNDQETPYRILSP